MWVGTYLVRLQATTHTRPGSGSAYETAASSTSSLLPPLSTLPPPPSSPAHLPLPLLSRSPSLLHMSQVSESLCFSPDPPQSLSISLYFSGIVANTYTLCLHLFFTAGLTRLSFSAAAPADAPAALQLPAPPDGTAAARAAEDRGDPQPEPPAARRGHRLELDALLMQVRKGPIFCCTAWLCVWLCVRVFCFVRKKTVRCGFGRGQMERDRTGNCVYVCGGVLSAAMQRGCRLELDALLMQMTRGLTPCNCLPCCVSCVVCCVCVVPVA